MSKCPILKNCDQCHKEFVVFKGPLQHKKFCSRNCYNEQIKSTKTNCLVCGIQIPSKNKYCSHSCAAGHTNKQRGTRSQETKDKIRQKLSGRQYPERRRILRPGTCIICNVPTIDVGRQTCSKTCKNRLHQLQSMLHPKCGGQKHTHRSKIVNSIGQEFVAESSYEVRLATILNDCGVKWIRPNYLLYSDGNNRLRRYYADFYLPDYDIYLDPKNDYLIQTDIEKIYLASSQNNVRIVIIGKNSLNESVIRRLVGDDGNAPPYSACKTDVLLLN